MVAKELTSRGVRTRQRLVDAAAVVFASQGYFDTKVTDITGQAGASNGSFYTYFESKDEIFSEVIRVVNERMRGALDERLARPASPRERIEHATRQYVRAYRADAKLVTLLEQVSGISPEFKAMRLETREKYRDRTERAVRRWQEEGSIDSQLPPRYAAEALTSMVSNFCFMWLGMEEDYDEETVVVTLSRMWGNALGLQPDIEPAG